MRITISSSSSDLINDNYLNTSRDVLEYLASNNYDLNYGSGNKSIMRLSYEIFNKYNRNIYGYTTEKYENEINDMPNARHNICNNTFDLKKGFYEDGDILLCLPGGIGTVSEFLSFIEEARSNDNHKLIILYNESNSFNSTLDLIDDLVKKDFTSKSIYDYFKVVNNLDELKKLLGDSNDN